MSWLVSGPALLCAALALLNALLVRRLRRLEREDPLPLTIAVPARNEARVLDACLLSLVAQPAAAILVLDDDSTDATAEIVRAWSARDGRVRLLQSQGPPAGWLGKPHACHQLTQAARTPWLLFVDADVCLEPGACASLLAAAREADAQLVTAVPRQVVRSFAERLVVPLLHLVYFALAPLFFVPRLRDPRVVAANGQVLLVQREAHLGFGGHSHPAVRAAVVEDVALCREGKRAGLRVLFADATEVARCRMYTSAQEVRQGFVKNLYLGIGATPLRALLVAGLLAWAFLLPCAVLPWAPTWAWPGVTALLALRVGLAVRFRHPPFTATLLHPLA
ncbi:MAG: glycosyltransferase, partial [Deltaproteobacteria bacterium]|nr:glycosyltransferase [Deltaproteobacteria bacterium]